MRLLIFFFLIMLIPSVVSATQETIYASYKYTMSDNDSKNDARRFAFIEAKKLAVEKVISFLENDPFVKDYSISKYEIKTYIDALINVGIDKEEFGFSSDAQTLNMTVKIFVDVMPVITTIDIIRVDKGLEEKVLKEQKYFKELEIKLNKIQKNLSAETKSDKAIYSRKSREDILLNMSDSRSKTESDIASEIVKLQKNIDITSNKVITNARNGMTTHELRNILGKPRRGIGYYDKANNKTLYCENYGKYWIIIDIDTVIGYLPYNSYKGCNLDIIKQLTAFEEIIRPDIVAQ